MHDLNLNYLRSLFIGLDKKVPISDKTNIIPINFDNAATTPVFKNVLNKIAESCEYYGSIGRGHGQKSEYSTKEYFTCRNYILNFFNAPKEKYTVIFINNTTDGINRLSNILIEDRNNIVISTRMEHHSNDLPWRRKCNLKYIDVDENGRLKLDELQYLLEKYNGLVKYVTITAASNVTGYLNDLSYISKLVHSYNAKLIVDAAQIVAHKKINISYYGIDFLVFSAHKMYAPFGSGAIIGLTSEFERLDSDIKGGGTVESVLDNHEILLPPPEKHEAGTPNFFGVIALVQALKQLENIGFDIIEQNEKLLLNYTLNGLNSIPKVITYGDTKNINDKLGIVVFNIQNIEDSKTSELLSNLRAIAVRHGAFCAHPYVKRLLYSKQLSLSRNINQECQMSGMVRASFGLYNSINEVDTFLNTVELICSLNP